jgi:hypothetical protein
VLTSTAIRDPRRSLDRLREPTHPARVTGSIRAAASDFRQRFTASLVPAPGVPIAQGATPVLCSRASLLGATSPWRARFLRPAARHAPLETIRTAALRSVEPILRGEASMSAAGRAAHPSAKPVQTPSGRWSPADAGGRLSDLVCADHPRERGGSARRRCAQRRRRRRVTPIATRLPPSLAARVQNREVGLRPSPRSARPAGTREMGEQGAAHGLDSREPELASEPDHQPLHARVDPASRRWQRRDSASPHSPHSLRILGGLPSGARPDTPPRPANHA